MNSLRRGLLGFPVLCALGACSDALVYGESTNFSLASIKVNENVAQPFSVNFALDRTVAAAAPAMTGDGETVNMIAGFSLTENGRGFFGTKRITTEFASGAAAEALARNRPTEALRILSIADYAEDDSSRCIDDWINEKSSERVRRVATLNNWWKNTGHTENSAQLRYTDAYASERRQFVDEHHIRCN